ncbi:MAG: chemotaxis protein CheX [Treponema sp.]|jgi:chemotaxis protein CheX|nr:chemotaxis protein CheX [Treponema sp.]
MEQYIEAFASVCTTVFKAMLNYDLEAGAPFYINRDKVKAWDVSALIRLSGEARGLVALSMKTDLAIAIAGKLTKKRHRFLDEEVIDAVGEMANIIAGNVTQKLENLFNLNISLPRILTGIGHEILWADTRLRIISVPFKLPDNHELCLLASLSPAPPGGGG